AVGDESGLVGGAVDGWADPLGVRLHTVDPLAPVLALSGPETDPGEPPRAVPLLGTGDASAAATSGTGPGPAAPIAPRPLTRLEAAAGQETPRPASTTSRRFGDPRVDPPSAGDSGRSAGAGGRSAHPSPLGPTIGRMLASQAVRATLPQTEPSQPVRPAAEEAPPSAGRHDGPRRPPAPHARPLAGQGPSPASPPVARAQTPSCEVARPGRASGMLPVPVVPGEALAAATARALAAAYGPSNPEDDDSDDEDAPDDRADAASRRHDPPRDDGPPGRAACMLPAGGSPWTPAAAAAAAAPAPRNSAACAHGPPALESPANVLPSPERAGSMLADQASPPPPPSAPPPSAAAAAAAPLVTAVAAAPATSPVGRAAVEPRARAEPPQEQAPPASARAEPMSGDVVSSDGSSRTTDVSGDGDDGADGAGSSDAAGDVGVVAMDVDQGARRQRPPWQRVGGKRRRLNDVDDEDTRELAELLLEEEDEVGAQAPALRLFAASAHPASVLSVYAHNAQRFVCTLCAYTAASFASLKRHRDSRHRRVSFVDKFSAGCACGTPFGSRLAAARHAQACASLSIPRTVTAPAAAGDLSPTATGANATASAAATSPDLPRPASPELAASPPQTSPFDVAIQADAAEQTAWTRWDPPLTRAAVAARVASRLAVVPAPRWGPPLSRTLVASRIAARLDAQTSRWGPPLPPAMVASRIASRLAAMPAPRWGPPLLRTVIASRIADRLLPPELAADEETKDDDVHMDNAASVDVDEESEVADVVMTDHDGEWLLRFDGACRANPGPGGAGAALFKPSGPVVWACSRYMPSSSATNNTAEYTALLLGARAAADHGATHLRVEGDSTLVIQQVRGIFAARSTRMRALRNQVQSELARVGSFSLHHIDRQDNAHADRLANRALDLRRTVIECGIHCDGVGCTATTTEFVEFVATVELVEPVTAQLAPCRSASTNSSSSSSSRTDTISNPPSPDEALDDLHAVERATPSDRRSIRRARRRVGRVNSAVEQQRLRHHFDTNEKGCVEILLAKARAQRSTTVARTAVGEPNSGAAEDDGTCPIPSERLHRHFTEVNTPGSSFDAMAPVGAPFRAALAHLPAATEASELLTEAPTPDEIEDQLQRAKGTTSPGLDGVGYDVYKAFSTQLLPVLHAAFQCCWQHHRVPQSWKQGIVRLLYKKGPREDPANWRPICLQQVIYKTYAGVLARRFTRWLAANGRHADAQKGFRTVNGCGEHNFLASTLIDHARRSRRELHMVWYDLKNAFGSVPQELLWEVLQRMGVPPAFVEVCQGLYQDAAFTVGNAADGPTDLVRQLVGVFQGCPLSPHLFTAAISPLLHALERLKDTGVRLSADDRPGASAYADDLKIFSGTADGVKRQHALVADFLRWTGMVANPNKCCTMSVQRDGRGLEDDDSDDEDAPDDRAAAASRRHDLPRDDGPPGRAACMLPAGGSPWTPAVAAAAAAPAPRDSAARAHGPPAPEPPAYAAAPPARAGGMLADQDPPPPSPAAAVAAPPAAAVAAEPTAPPADRAAAEHRARADLNQEQDLQVRARAEPTSGEAVSSRSCGRTTTAPRNDTAAPDETKTEESDAEAAKLRCIEAPTPSPHPTELRPDHGLRDSVQAVYAHNAAAFECALCPYAARDLTALAAHRRTAHRGTCFVDHFHSGCTCGIGFQSRAAATKHALACGQSAHVNEAAARDRAMQEPATPALSAQRTEVAPAPTGPLRAAVPAAVAATSSGTAAAGAAHTQSAVPTASGHPHVPPAGCPLQPPPELRIGGKRRRLNNHDDVELAVDLDELMQEAEDELLDELTDAMEPLATNACPTPPAPTTPRTTRWGPRHQAVGAAAIARLVTGEETVPAPPRRRTLPPTALGRRATRTQRGERQRRRAFIDAAAWPDEHPLGAASDSDPATSWTTASRMWGPFEGR
uniref:RNase H type-1 domain-containing protein n=1 Tax=Phytophthora ramorum TaxID=164328 RepID=H3H5C5_PHYRM